MRALIRTNASAAWSRVCATGIVLAVTFFSTSCGDYYRPVAQPIEGLQPSPAQAHSVISINADGITDNNRAGGSASNIDVSGDSIQGNLTVGIAPAHAALTPDGTKLYVANSAEDSVTANNTSGTTTAAATISLPPSKFASITSVSGGGGVATYTYSGSQLFAQGDLVFISGCSTAGFNGVFTVTGAPTSNSFTVMSSTTATDATELAGAEAKAPNPVFVGTAENANVYVAGYSTNSVYVIDTNTDVVSATVPVGVHPVSIAELPNAQQVFVADQGNSAGVTAVAGDVRAISTTNDTVTQTIALPAGAVPVWAVAKRDSSRVYVLDASGAVFDMDPSVNGIRCTAPLVACSSTAISAGANFLTFEPVLSRLYVTNPAADQVIVLDASVDPPKLLNTINLATAATSVCFGCAPDSVTVLGDGSRAYVAVYQFSSGCTDSSGNSVNCVDSFVAVIDGLSAKLKSVIPPFGRGAALTSTGCGPGSGPVPSVWKPGVARFRVSIASSGGQSNSPFKIYVSQCDAGSVAVIDTFPANGNPADTYSGVSLLAPLSTFPPLSSGVPPSENPVLLVPGP